MAKQIQETDDDLELLAEIKEQQKHIDDLAAVLAEKKEETKLAREEWEAAVERLGAIIRDGEERPLLDS